MNIALSGGLEPTVALVTALPKEQAAARQIFTESTPLQMQDDATLYIHGRVPAAQGLHSVILACLPKYGNNAAGITTTNILRSFPSLKDVIFLGICAGVPRPNEPHAHTRLGDIIVSSGPGVVQFDLGANTLAGFDYRAAPPPPSARLLQAANMLEANFLITPTLWRESLSVFLNQTGVSRPAHEPPHDFRHPRDPDRHPGTPRIFRGLIGASNTLMRNPDKRDEIAQKHHLLAFEMEGSGVADAAWDAGLGYLLVRSVCDYGDSHKNDSWQQYAATVAAAYIQSLLGVLPPSDSDAHPLRERNQDVRASTLLGGSDSSVTHAARAASDRRTVSDHLNIPSEAITSGLSIHVSDSRLTVAEWVNDTLLVCAGFDGYIHWLDLESSRLQSTPATNTKIRSVLAHDDCLLIGDDSGQLSVMPIDTRVSCAMYHTNAAIYALACDTSSQRIYSADNSGALIEWDGHDGLRNLRKLSVLASETTPLFCVATHSGIVLCGSGAGTLLSRDTHTGRVDRRALSTAAIFCISTRRDTNTIACGTADGALYIINPITTDITRDIGVRLHDDTLRAMVTCGRWVITSSKDCTIKAYDTTTGSVEVLWQWATEYSYGICLSPSHTRLAAVSGGGRVVILTFPRPLDQLDILDLRSTIQNHE